MDTVSLVAILVCALVGFGLSLWWLRIQRRDPEAWIDDYARRQAPRLDAGATPRPPPPTPDLVSIREAWLEREDTEEAQRPPIDLAARRATQPHTADPAAQAATPPPPAMAGTQSPGSAGVRMASPVGAGRR